MAMYWSKVQEAVSEYFAHSIRGRKKLTDPFVFLISSIVAFIVLKVPSVSISMTVLKAVKPGRQYLSLQDPAGSFV